MPGLCAAGCGACVVLGLLWVCDLPPCKRRCIRRRIACLHLYILILRLFLAVVPGPNGSSSDLFPFLLDHSASGRERLSEEFLGIAFLGIGLWAWNEKGVLSNISSITDLGGFDPVWLFLVVGGVMFILGFAGCIGALRENTFLLKFFSVFLGIIFFLELTAGVLAFVFKDWIKDQLYFFINNNIRAYRDDIDLQNLIDFTQEYWQCCGAFGADDWNLNIYFNCTDSNASRERCGVPFSCCTKDPAEDVINTQCGYDARQKPEVDQQIVIYTKGCVPQFEKWLQDNLTIVAGIFIGIALLQLYCIGLLTCHALL
uniref:Tetraspanin 5 n=1 Tax=Anser brachyrhynchus TaxID=132585 RepID=A0A8B9BIC4_9AVES